VTCSLTRFPMISDSSPSGWIQESHSPLADRISQGLLDLHFLLFLISDRKWVSSHCMRRANRKDTLVANSDMSEVGCSSKRKFPSLDLILTSCAYMRNDLRAMVEK
jgi:hypothetical protein